MSQFLESFLVKQLHTLESEREHVLQPEDPETIHRLRVASRRLRAFFETFPSFFSPKQTHFLWREIRRITQGLADARELDVQIEFLTDRQEDQETGKPAVDLSPFIAWLQTKRDTHQKTIRKVVKNLEKSKVFAKAEKAMERAQASGASPPNKIENGTIPLAGLQEIRARLNDFLSFQDVGEREVSDERLHQMRIAAKKLRYVLELHEPLDENSIQEVMNAARKIQSFLGKIHDLDVLMLNLRTFLDERERRRDNAETLPSRGPAGFSGDSPHFGNGSSLRDQAGPPESLIQLEQELIALRASALQEFKDYWNQMKSRQAWNGLIEYLHSRKKDESLLQEEKLKSVVRLADRFDYDKEHAGQVARICRQIFGDLQPLHNLGEREKALLHYGALLHDIGWVAGRKSHHKTAMNLIMHSPELSIDQEERLFAALLARYHRRALPKPSHRHYSDLPPRSRKTLRQLVSILRVANALDRTRRGVVRNLSCKISDEKIEVRCHVRDAADEELQTARREGRLLEKEFGRKLVVECATA